MQMHRSERGCSRSTAKRAARFGRSPRLPGIASVPKGLVVPMRSGGFIQGLLHPWVHLIWYRLLYQNNIG